MGNINILGSDVQRDPGLETSILISLFSDRRADIEDALPDNSGDRRGWWGDTADDKIGSRLWLIMRSTMSADIPGKLNQYIDDALAWMITDGVAKEISHEVEKVDYKTFMVTIKIQQPDGQDNFFKYSYNWDAEILKRG